MFQYYDTTYTITIYATVVDRTMIVPITYI